MKSQKVNLFLAGFRHLEPMCSLKQPLASLADKVLYPGCNDQRRSSQSDIASKLESVIGSKVSRLKREIYFRMSTMKPFVGLSSNLRIPYFPNNIRIRLARAIFFVVAS